MAKKPFYYAREMAKLKAEKISVTDIEKYLESSSDFAFEIRVLNRLSALGFDCQHGGTYRDPVTGATREFDIRATYRKQDCRVATAVECKNFRDNYPLVLHCLPRKRNEAYQEYFVGYKDSGPMGHLSPPVKIEKFYSEDCIYVPGDLVAKSTEQVGYRLDGTITTGDSEAFNRISQAINSCYGLIESAAESFPGDKYSFHPILVVPDEKIWVIPYDEHGNRTDKPFTAPHMSVFIGMSWYIDRGLPMVSISYSISHLEIVAYSGLELFVRDFLLSNKSVLRFRPS